jgi:hypothetical protein
LAAAPRQTHSCHHRAAAISAFTRVFDALWRRDPVIQLFAKKMDRPVKPGDDSGVWGDDTVCFDAVLKLSLESVEVFAFFPNKRTR